MGWFSGEFQALSDRAPGDYENVTVGAVAAGLTAAKVYPATGPAQGTGARVALVTGEGGDMRFRVDGGVPTANSGHFLAGGDTLVIPGPQALSQFRAIRSGDTDGVLRVTYFY